jgi:hypothetical protein
MYEGKYNIKGNFLLMSNKTMSQVKAVLQATFYLQATGCPWPGLANNIKNCENCDRNHYEMSL